MQWLAALCVKRPVFATVLILSLTVIGAYSFTKLGVDRFPKIDIPTIVVTTVQPGAAPFIKLALVLGLSFLFEFLNPFVDGGFFVQFHAAEVDCRRQLTGRIHARDC